MPGYGAPWADLNRRTVRAPVNPLDKTTIFSIYPVAISEKKLTLQPSQFEIPAGTYDKPARLVVGPSSWWRELSTDEPLLEIPVSSLLVAESVIRDYANGLVECNMADRMPGLFFIPGEVEVFELQKSPYKKYLELANTKQQNWYQELIKQGDILWARTNGNPLSISDDMRRAARELNEDRDWAKAMVQGKLVKCLACGHLNNSEIIVCPNCKVVLDAEKFGKLGLVFAK
jgi:hypothetical protein